MDFSTIVIIAVIALCVVLLIAVLFTFSFYVYSAFVARQDRNPKLKYYASEHFNLTVEQVEITYRRKQLYGAIYCKKTIETCEKLIIFAHGMGAGHCAYTTEIAYYCDKGYAVLAYDNYGCDRSEGKNIRAFYTGAECVIAAYIAAKNDNRLKDKPTYLVGHSWGAYSVLCASDKIKVDGVVAFSAFNSPYKISKYFLKSYLNTFVAAIITPWLWVINKIYGDKKAAKTIEKSGTPALLVWGEKDVSVNSKNSAALIADGQNITKLILPDKGHNPYNTVAAEQKLAELVAAISDKQTPDDYFANFDYDAATKEDEEVMQKTVDFIESRK